MELVKALWSCALLNCCSFLESHEDCPHLYWSLLTPFPYSFLWSFYATKSPHIFASPFLPITRSFQTANITYNDSPTQQIGCEKDIIMACEFANVPARLHKTWHWRCCASGDTSCGFIDFTFALLLKIYLRFRGSFLRFHNTAGACGQLPPSL